MIAFMMIRWGLPVMPGALAMLGVSFLGGLFLSDYTAVAISYWNAFMQWIEMWVEYFIYWVAGPEALIATWQTYDEQGNIAKTYHTYAEWYEQENGGGTVHQTPTAFGLGLANFFDFLILRSVAFHNSSTPVITFMVLYYIAEFTIFFKMLGRIKRRGEKLPEIKQRFEV